MVPKPAIISLSFFGPALARASCASVSSSAAIAPPAIAAAQAYGAGEQAHDRPAVRYEPTTEQFRPAPAFAAEKAQRPAAAKFQMGDSVMVYPQRKIGIVYRPADAQGLVTVQIEDKKIKVKHKRLKIKAKAADLYPPDYDFSIIFDSVSTRKARHSMERKHVEGLKIVLDE